MGCTIPTVFIMSAPFNNRDVTLGDSLGAVRDELETIFLSWSVQIVKKYTADASSESTMGNPVNLCKFKNQIIFQHIFYIIINS